MIKVVRLFGMCKCIDLSEEERTTCPHCTDRIATAEINESSRHLGNPQQDFHRVELELCWIQ